SERDEMTVFREDGDEEYAPNELGPPAALDGAMPTEPEPATDDDLPQIEGALRLLRRGLRETPELRAGIGYTIGLAMALTAGRLLIPILIQQIFDRGLTGPDGFRPGYVYSACAVAAGGWVLGYFAGGAA